MKMKRLFTLVLSLMMILSLSAPDSAIDGENVYTKEEISSINEVNVAKYAKSFVETIDSTADVTAGNVLTTVQSSVPRMGDTLFWLLAM